MFGLFKRNRRTKVADQPLGNYTLGSWSFFLREEAIRSRDPLFEGDPFEIANQFLSENGVLATPLEILISSDGRAPVRVAAAIKAGFEKRTECVSPLLAMLTDPEEVVRRIAAACLTLIGTIEALNAVVGGRQHGRGIRVAAAYQLKEMGAGAIPAIPALFNAIREPIIHPMSSFHFADAIVATGETGREYLIHVLHHGSKRSKFHAACALKENNPDPEHSELIQSIIDEELGDVELDD